MEMEKMKQRWKNLWNKLDAKTSGRIEFSELIHLYNQSHRKYHNLQHIHDSLKEMDEVYDFIKQPLEVEIAIWYHDSIYNPEKDDNEEKSAELAEKVLYESGLEKHFIDDVSSMILATKHNRNNVKGNDTRYLVDIDLTQLGKPYEEFKENSKKIRLEYSWVPEKTFKEERKKILENFLDKPNIYHTDYFRKKYEDQARENLEREIKNLS